MAIKILKHQLTHQHGQQYVEMHLGARIIHAGVQNNLPTLWAEEDTSMTKAHYVFECFHTGDSVPSDLHHVATFVMDSGTYILHVYE